uniref:Nuclear cap-binding protein subunit 3 n=1 Tax=Angiostrongylus cantonensis TaxID=6313 RepID=A0A0K0DAM1_ANGCA
MTSYLILLPCTIKSYIEDSNARFGDVGSMQKTIVNCAGNESRRFEFSNDLTYLQGLKFGRMSFKGCNPEVEKLMVYYERKMKGEDSDSDYEDGKDVGDEEMAKTLRSTSLTNDQKLKLTKSRKQSHTHSRSVNESPSGRLNFTDIRKRRSIGTWASGDSRRKLTENN